MKAEKQEVPWLRILSTLGPVCGLGAVAAMHFGHFETSACLIAAAGIMGVCYLWLSFRQGR
jgi:hypothetical protein